MEKAMMGFQVSGDVASRIMAVVEAVPDGYGKKNKAETIRKMVMIGLEQMEAYLASEPPQDADRAR